MRKIFAAIIVFVSVYASAQETNKTDSKGLRHGLWKGIYEDTKRPRYEGTFDHGKETGIFKFYDNTKASPVVATRDFSAKDGSCYTTFYGPKGLKTGEGKEVNKLREGEWKFYHENATTVLSSENYVKGKLQGVRKVFFPGSALAEETGYVNGVKEGVYKKYTEKGVVLEDAVYKNGEYHGPATFRNPSNELVSQGQFRNGKKSGIWKYYQKGKLVKEVNMNTKRPPKEVNQ